MRDREREREREREIEKKKEIFIGTYELSFNSLCLCSVLSPRESSHSRSQVRGRPSVVPLFLYGMLGNYPHYTL